MLPASSMFVLWRKWNVGVLHCQPFVDIQELARGRVRHEDILGRVEKIRGRNRNGMTQNWRALHVGGGFINVHCPINILTVVKLERFFVWDM